MKLFFKITTYSIIFFFVACSGSLIYFKDHITCGEENEMVEYARGLSQERLENLYYSMEKHSKKPPTSYTDYNSHKEFKDIEAHLTNPFSGSIILRHCRDEMVRLNFDGVGPYKEYDKNRQIVLSWGDGPYYGKQVLWIESEDNSNDNQERIVEPQKDKALARCSSKEDCEYSNSILGTWSYNYRSGDYGFIEYQDSGDKCEMLFSFDRDNKMSTKLYWNIWRIEKGVIETFMYKTNAGIPKFFQINDKILEINRNELNVVMIKPQTSMATEYHQRSNYSKSGKVCDIVKKRLVTNSMDSKS